MKRENWYLSTIDPRAADCAKRHGLGLEIAEYCTAWNMDERFAETDEAVRKKLEGIAGRVLHAPFNELFPCAIDPGARELARHRYRQALSLAASYGAEKVVIHGGYHPYIYYPCWYTEQSAAFWKEFLQEVPGGVTVCLENVLEKEPEMLLEILRETDDPRLRICLDVGHVNAYSSVPCGIWLERLAPWISHFHLHNNDGQADTHSPLYAGSLNMEKLLQDIGRLCPEATCTLELPDSAGSVEWLEEIGFWEENYA